MEQISRLPRTPLDRHLQCPNRDQRQMRQRRTTGRTKMSPENKDKSIKITLDDLASVSLPDASAQVPAAQTAGGAKVYGSISEASDPQTQIAEEKGSILLQGWFYLGAAGLLGALIGWGICEPRFVDSGQQGSSRWGNWL